MFQSFVNGKSIAGKLRPLFNSYTLEQYGLACDMADPDIAIHAAKTAPPNPDRTILLKVAALLQRDRLELAKLESQAGKPLSQSLQDVDSACEVFTYYSSYCGNLVGQSFGYDSSTVRYPIGVCGLITSYNYPLLLAAWKTAPCIAAGNSIVLKPSPYTPGSSVKLAHLFQEAGLPDGVFNVVIGSNQVGSQICRHSDVGMVSFTGSTCAGRNVAVNCAERLIPYTLELGGNNPVIVCNDADIEKAVAAIVEGAFTNMGQNCCSASRIYIHSSVYDQVVAQIVILTQKLKIGDPMNIETFIGPLATQDHFSKVMQAISTFSETEDILCGGSALGLTIQPTIYANVSEDSQLAQKEIFGPVLAIMKPFETIQEVIQRVNISAYGLVASIWTNDLKSSAYAVKNIEAGLVWVNNYNCTPVWLPFGGIKDSGVGKELGYQALNSFTKSKSLLWAT